MESSDKSIKHDLEKLPLILPDKILIWLVYKDKKPATEIWIDPARFHHLEKILRIEYLKIRRIENFLKKAGLKYIIVTQDFGKNRSFGKYGDNQKYDCVGFVISKSSENVEKLYKILSSDKEGEKIHQELGKLYGFPSNAVKAFSRTFKDDDVFERTMSNQYTTQHKYKNKYWFPYTMYKVRVGHEIEDSKLGRVWADTIRADLPDLAAEFEHNSHEFWEEMKHTDLIIG